MKTITNYIKRFLLLAAMAVMSATALGAGTYCDSPVTGGTMSYETTATNTYKVTYTSTYQLTGVANCNFYYYDNGGVGQRMSFSKVDVNGYVWAATFVTTYTSGELTYANYCAFYKKGGGDVAVNFPPGSKANYAGTCSSVTVTIGEKTSTYNSVTLNWSVSGGTPTAQTVRYKESGTETWSNGPSVLANATSATITRLDPSTTYDLKVIATVSSVDYEDTDTKATTALPSVATSGTTVTSNSVKVDWTRSNFSNVSAQTVYYKKTSDNEYSSADVGSTSALTYTLSSLQCGTAYDIYVSVTEDETDYDSDEVEATPSNTSTQLPVTSATASGNLMTISITGFGGSGSTYNSGDTWTMVADAGNSTTIDSRYNQDAQSNLFYTLTGIPMSGTNIFTLTNVTKGACAVLTFSGTTLQPVTACSSPCGPTVTIGTATSTSSSITVPFSHSNFTSTPTFTEQHRISPSGTWSTAATVTSPAVITGLSEGTSYDIKITGTYLEETDYDEETVATTIMAAPRPPVRSASSVKSIYSTAYTPAVTTFTPHAGWGGAEADFQYVDLKDAEDNDIPTLHYTNLGYIGMNYNNSGTALDISNMNRIHFDIYNEEDENITIRWEIIEDGQNKDMYRDIVLEPGWGTLDFSLDEGWTVDQVNTKPTQVNQLKVSLIGEIRTDIDLYIDNIYYYIGECAVELNKTAETSTSVSLQWETVECSAEVLEYRLKYVETGKTDSITFMMPQLALSATVPNLKNYTSYTFSIAAVSASTTTYGKLTCMTTNPTTCFGESDVKNTLDGSLANNCNFTVPYEFEITTSDLTENDPTVLVRYKYTQSQSIDNNQVKLCRMFKEGQIESELQMTAEAGGTGWWYINLEGETLGKLSVGDSVKFAIKVVPVDGCTGGARTFYATRMFAYKVGVGCNDARAFEFTKRLASQTTFFIQTDASIQRILVKKKGSSEYIQDNHIEPAASKFALDIRGYELGTYEFEIFDESGRSDDIKIIHTVY